MPIRQPIVCVLGHVDTGKTLLLDQIRRSSVQAREAGGMTQHIGASFFPVETLAELCGPLLRGVRGELRIPGLLVIDTPGHEAFANLRRRGGAVADIAILVIDVLKGFEEQTYECLEILRARKTPFLVAANKLDRVPGWRPNPGRPLLESYRGQEPQVRQDLDERLYAMMGPFSRLGLQANRFDEITDFTRTVAIVPTSAKTGEGVPELLAVLIGLTQQYLGSRLQVTEGPARGTVLEVKEEAGLGITVNAIIYDGVLRREDSIVVGGREKPIATRIRAILLPKPLDEIRDPRDRFSSVDSVSAAAGVKIAAPNLEEALAGAPLYAVPPGGEAEQYVASVSEEVERLRIATDVDGVVLKTDALGSLEAIAESLTRGGVPIRLADVGDISKRDVTEAAVVGQSEPLYGVVLGFNVRVLPDAEEEAQARGVRVFRHNVIYHLIEEYTGWLRERREARLQLEFEGLVRPGRIRVIPGYVFRRAKPAIVGVEIQAGRIRPRYHLVEEDGREVGEVAQIQDRGEAIPEAKAGSEVAISMSRPVVGRHVNEGDILLVKVPEDHAKALLTRFQDRLDPGELEALNAFVGVMRRKNPLWAA